LQPILFHVCECVSHLSFHPAHGFPNNWKIDGDYPPAGGQCNSYLWEFTGKRNLTLRHLFLPLLPKRRRGAG
jgi:hypothetical protein